MYKLIKTRQAEEDLVEIWLYTLKKWGVMQADQYIDELECCFDRLRASPGIGVSRAAVRPGFYSLPVHKHIAYYKLTNQTIELMRVLHARMDPDRQL